MGTVEKTGWGSGRKFRCAPMEFSRCPGRPPDSAENAGRMDLARQVSRRDNDQGTELTESPPSRSYIW